jgi:hypothetical protein
MGEWHIGTYERGNKAQTFSNLHSRYVPEDLVKGGIEYSCGLLYMNVQGSPVEIQALNALEPNQPQHDCPAACVIAQHSFSATFISLNFHSSEEKFGMLLKNFTISVP